MNKLYTYINKMPYQKKDKTYINNYQARYLRKKRAEMVKKDPLAMRSTVWVVEGTNGKQLVFRDRKDIKIQRIPKQDMKTDCIKAF